MLEGVGGGSSAVVPTVCITALLKKKTLMNISLKAIFLCVCVVKSLSSPRAPTNIFVAGIVFTVSSAAADVYM